MRTVYYCFFVLSFCFSLYLHQTWGLCFFLRCYCFCVCCFSWNHIFFIFVNVLWFFLLYYFCSLCGLFVTFVLILSMLYVHLYYTLWLCFFPCVFSRFSNFFLLILFIAILHCLLLQVFCVTTIPVAHSFLLFLSASLLFFGLREFRLLAVLLVLSFYLFFTFFFAIFILLSPLFGFTHFCGTW